MVRPSRYHHAVQRSLTPLSMGLHALPLLLVAACGSDPPPAKTPAPATPVEVVPAGPSEVEASPAEVVAQPEKRPSTPEIIPNRAMGDTTCATDADCTVSTESDECCECCPRARATSRKWLAWWVDYKPKSCAGTTCPSCAAEDCMGEQESRFVSVCQDGCQLARRRLGSAA